MKIDRHIGIIALLQRGKKVTAPYLAEKFEVSRRTINRDIDDICRAGIPIVTERGGGGGISLAEGYSLDTTLFTQNELSTIVAGLRSLDSVSRKADGEKLASKFTGGDVPDGGDISVDLASFYGDSLPEKIELLRAAISLRRNAAFRYYYAKGEEDKQIEPYKLVFRWSDWYLFGYCPARGDFRLYKLRRLWNLRICDEIYEAREIPEEKLTFGTNMTDSYMITAVFDPAVKYRLIEDYGPGSFTVRGDGMLLFSRGFTDPDTAVLWLLGFGENATVTEPPELIEKIKLTARKIATKYN
jgi:Predicted transcriptional regulator